MFFIDKTTKNPLKLGEKRAKIRVILASETASKTAVWGVPYGMNAERQNQGACAADMSVISQG